jgi:hypothetical protein
VGGARLVEGEVRLERAGDDLVRDEVVEHEDVRLLDDLCRIDALGTEQQISGDRPSWGDVRNAERLETEEAGELLVDAGVRVVAVDQCLRQL